MRANKELLDWDLPNVSIERFCELRGDEIVVNESKAIDAALHTRPGKFAQRDTYLESLGNLKKGAPSDTRSFANGHDLADLLKWHLSKWAKKSGVKKELIQGSLYACFEYEYLKSHNLFAELVNRCQP